MSVRSRAARPARAVSLHPDVAAARAALATGDLQTAAAVCTQRLEESKHDHNARLTLADAQLLSGRTDDAIANVRRVARAHASNPLVWVKLAHMHLRSSQWRRALDACEKALRVQPGCVPALAVQAKVHERCGRPELAEDVLAEEMTAPVPHADAAAVIVRLHVQAERLDEAIAFAERFEDTHGRSDAALRDVLFARVKAHERRDELTLAFETARRANALYERSWDHDRERRRIDEIRAATTRDALSRIPRARPGAHPVVFIVGMPRTGSTLVERILKRHPDVGGLGEEPVVQSLAQRLHQEVAGGPYPHCLPMLDEASVAAARRSVLETMRRLADSGPVLVSKDLGNVLHVGLISRILPEARIVVTRRDPVDTGASCWMEPLGHAGTGYAADLEDCGRQHRLVDELIDHWRAESDLPMHELHYEALVQDPQSTIEALVEFCGLSWHEDCLTPHELDRPEQTISFAAVRKPISAARIGRAARYGDRFDPLRRALAGD